MVTKTISRETYQKLARLSAQGIILVILTFLGLMLGMEIDTNTGMVPTFTIGLLITGFSIGIWGFYREAIGSK